MSTEFLVHNTGDNVGVVVVEDIQAGQRLSGWLLETDGTLALEAKEDIPLGHKIAVSNITDGDTVIEYGHDIGRSVSNIAQGSHVHVHNIKTKRW
jgi:(2R)-sulfolactate sulfo-lyase subunit alpha